MKKRYARWQLVVLGILRFLVATLSMSIACYIVFALVFSTEEERTRTMPSTGSSLRPKPLRWMP